MITIFTNLSLSLNYNLSLLFFLYTKITISSIDSPRIWILPGWETPHTMVSDAWNQRHLGRVSVPRRVWDWLRSMPVRVKIPASSRGRLTTKRSLRRSTFRWRFRHLSILGVPVEYVTTASARYKLIKISSFQILEDKPGDKSACCLLVPTLGPLLQVVFLILKYFAAYLLQKSACFKKTISKFCTLNNFLNYFSNPSLLHVDFNKQ